MGFCLRILVLCLALFVGSCKINGGPATGTAGDGTYFSVKAFASDQWKTFHHQPFGIVKIASLNGTTDTLYTNADHVNWGDIFKVFFETDISDKKFLDQYDFSQFRDEMTASDNHIYEAKDNKLLTQKLNVITNIYTGKITSVYIETIKKTWWSTFRQKLLYVPVKSISIQQFESSVMGKDKDLRIEYRFL